MIRLLAAGVIVVATVAAAPAIFPLKDVRPGQRGVGKTVFSGAKVEEFQVEVLGVLENIGPRQSIILARLSGGPLADTGVMQGMSGSPVYIGGKLAGAVALGFPQAKEPIAGIRPIEEMLRVAPDVSSPPPAALARRKYLSGDLRLEEIATPVSFSGFTAAALEQFAPRLRELGLDPRQGVSGGGNPPDVLGDPSKLEPGSMISVQLLSGDMSVSADGSVTAIDGNRVYAFGHRFLASGSTDFPFARAEVLALLPNLASSFKISQAKEWMGTITEDRDTAIAGLTGRRAATSPMEIRVGPRVYRMKVIQDRVMTPLVAQMAVFSAIDATERSVGAATYSVRGRAQFDGGSLKLDNVYSGDVNVAALASAGVATPLSYVLGSGFDVLRLKDLTLEVAPLATRNQMQIADLAAPRSARPGDDVPLSVVLTGDNGVEIVKKSHYRIPVGAPAGPLYVTASDAAAANLAELQAALGSPARSPGQVLQLANGLRSNTNAYLRLWRVDADFTADGRDLPGLPASLAIVFGRAQAASSGSTLARGAKVAEIAIPAGDNVVTGSKTIQIEVKE
ncbi:MAG TPA: SpoIVB peptidase S55 domain-containing protein [Bryobacteraceae bacterium]|nr:SpoIVB peptidase S55 domain-containing protein [Bryobacteraceae bacterium]